jgi:hypothetical protein
MIEKMEMVREEKKVITTRREVSVQIASREEEKIE